MAENVGYKCVLRILSFIHLYDTTGNTIVLIAITHKLPKIIPGNFMFSVFAKKIERGIFITVPITDNTDDALICPTPQRKAE